MGLGLQMGVGCPILLESVFCWCPAGHTVVLTVAVQVTVIIIQGLFRHASSCVPPPPPRFLIYAKLEEDREVRLSMAATSRLWSPHVGACWSTDFTDVVNLKTPTLSVISLTIALSDISWVSLGLNLSGFFGDGWNLPHVSKQKLNP